jgi:hypothetical protein
MTTEEDCEGYSWRSRSDGDRFLGMSYVCGEGQVGGESRDTTRSLPSLPATEAVMSDRFISSMAIYEGKRRIKYCQDVISINMYVLDVRILRTLIALF